MADETLPTGGKVRLPDIGPIVTTNPASHWPLVLGARRPFVSNKATVFKRVPVAVSKALSWKTVTVLPLGIGGTGSLNNFFIYFFFIQ